MKRYPDRLHVIGTAGVSVPLSPGSPHRDRGASPVPLVADASLLPSLHRSPLHDHEPCPVPLDDAEAWFANLAERDDEAAWAEQILIEAHLDRILAEPW